MQCGRANQEGREGSQRAGGASLDGADFRSDRVDMPREATAGGPYGRLSFSLDEQDEASSGLHCSVFHKVGNQNPGSRNGTLLK